MGDVIFCRPDYEYGTYVDLHRLIELSGYPLIKFNDMDIESDNTYIVTMLNGECINGWVEPKARIILYDLEWHIDDHPNVPGVSELWAADAWYAHQIGADYVPLGSHPGLSLQDPFSSIDKVYDVAPMMYTYGRREAIVNELLRLNVRVAPNAWNPDRDVLLRASQFMLHVHQHNNAPTIAPQRFALAAAYHMPMISESVADMGIFADAGIAWAGFDTLAELVSDCVSHPEYNYNGDELYRLLCVDKTFRVNIEAAL